MHELFITILIVLVSAAIVMGLWNAIIPELASSVDIKYEKGTFANINYTTALGLVVLTGVLFKS